MTLQSPVAPRGASTQAVRLRRDEPGSQRICSTNPIAGQPSAESTARPPEHSAHGRRAASGQRSAQPLALIWSSTSAVICGVAATVADRCSDSDLDALARTRSSAGKESTWCRAQAQRRRVDARARLARLRMPDGPGGRESAGARRRRIGLAARMPALCRRSAACLDGGCPGI